MVCRGNPVRLTYYGWDERLDYAKKCMGKGHNPVSLLVHLTDLYRHINGEVFTATEENDERQDRFQATCEELKVRFTDITKLAERQRFYEAKRREEECHTKVR